MVDHDEILAVMTPGDSYTAGDIYSEGDFDVTQRTIANELRLIAAEGRVERTEHTSAVTYKIPDGCSCPDVCPHCGEEIHPAEESESESGSDRDTLSASLD